MLNERSKIKGKKTLLYFYKILESAYCSDRKQINSFLGMVAGASYDGREEGITKGHKETGGDGYGHCLDCGDSSLGVYICQNLSNCTF